MNETGMIADPDETSSERWWRKQWYRDLWMLTLTIFLVIVAVKLLAIVDEQREGRRLGTAITCTITSSILQGSHSFIVASAEQPLPPKLENRFVEEGYPTKAVRELQATDQADAYTKAISQAVISAVGPKAKGLITESEKESKGTKPAGAVNCAQLKTITKVH